MAADASIFSQYRQPVRSVSDYAADFDKREANQLALAAQRQQGEIAGFQMQQAKADMAEKAAARNALQQAMSSWTSATTPAERAASLRNSRSPDLWKQADAIEAGQRGALKEQADIDNIRGRTAKDAAETAAKTADAAYEKVQRHAQNIEWVRSDADIAAYIDAGIANGVPGFTQEMRSQALAKARELGGVEQWKRAAFAGAIPVVERFKSQADAARAQLAADTQIRTTSMNNATSRANNAASIAQQERQSVRTDRRLGEGNEEIREQRRTDKKVAEDDKAIQKFSATLQKEGIPDIETAVSGAEAALNRYKKGEVPGIGRLKNALPAAVMSDEGKDVRQALASVRNIVLSARSGAAVTDQELRRLVEEIGTGAGMSEDDARKGLAKIRTRLDTIKTNAAAGVSDDVLNAYRDRGGLDIKRGAGKAPAGRVPPNPAGADPVAEALKKYGG